MRIAQDVIADTLKPGIIGSWPGAERLVAIDIKESLEREGFTIHPPGFKDAINAEVARLNDIIRSENRRAEDAHGEAQQWSLKYERLKDAIRATACQGNYDEVAIRKVVSFELAEMITAMRREEWMP